MPRDNSQEIWQRSKMVYQVVNIVRRLYPEPVRRSVTTVIKCPKCGGDFKVSVCCEGQRISGTCLTDGCLSI